MYISIHAPSRERPFHKFCLQQDTDFNPRSLAGATTITAALETSDSISIHAPSRERPPFSIASLGPVVFQSTLPRGSDHYHVILFGYDFRFQSTLPRGSDLRTRNLSGWNLHFNPRSLAGATPANLLPFIQDEFQSTLPRGSDIIPGIPYIGIGHFNPRSLAGATVPPRASIS